MALAAAADGHVAVETALTAATLQSSSSVWLAQFPSEFDLSRLAGSKLKLRSAPNAAGELLSGKLADGTRLTFVAEDPSLAAQLFVVAAPSSRAVQVQHRLTALVREADAGDVEMLEDGAGGAAAVTVEPEAAPVAAPEEERPNKKKRKDREDGEARKEKKSKKEKKSRKDKG